MHVILTVSPRSGLIIFSKATSHNRQGKKKPLVTEREQRQAPTTHTSLSNRHTRINTDGEGGRRNLMTHTRGPGACASRRLGVTYTHRAQSIAPRRRDQQITMNSDPDPSSTRWMPAQPRSRRRPRFEYILHGYNASASNSRASGAGGGRRRRGRRRRRAGRRRAAAAGGGGARGGARTAADGGRAIQLQPRVRARTYTERVVWAARAATGPLAPCGGAESRDPKAHL